MARKFKIHENCYFDFDSGLLIDNEGNSISLSNKRLQTIMKYLVCEMKCQAAQESQIMSYLKKEEDCDVDSKYLKDKLMSPLRNDLKYFDYNPISNKNEIYVKELREKWDPIRRIDRPDCVGFVFVPGAGGGFFVDENGNKVDQDEETSKDFSSTENESIKTSEKTSDGITRISTDKVNAIKAYSNVWDEIEKLFLRPELVKFKPYFDEYSDKLPEGEEELELGIALSLRLRDGIQYSQALLSFIPERYRVYHTDYKEKIMSASITKEALDRYRFKWEESEHNILSEEEVYVDSIVAFSKYWTDMGEVFLDPKMAKYRKYFFEASDDELPKDKEEIEALKSIAMLYKNAMKYSELLLDSIPREFRDSYYKFKDTLRKTNIFKEIEMDF